MIRKAPSAHIGRRSSPKSSAGVPDAATMGGTGLFTCANSGEVQCRPSRAQRPHDEVNGLALDSAQIPRFHSGRAWPCAHHGSSRRPSELLQCRNARMPAPGASCEQRSHRRRVKLRRTLCLLLMFVEPEPPADARRGSGSSRVHRANLSVMRERGPRRHPCIVGSSSLPSRSQ